MWQKKVVKLIICAYAAILLLRQSKLLFMEFNTANVKAKEKALSLCFNSNYSILLKNVLIFSRVPKTGSEMMVRLLQALALRNNFVHTRFGAPQPRKLSWKQQVKQLQCNAMESSTYFLSLCLSASTPNISGCDSCFQNCFAW